jgi:hypothetical protein
MTIRQRSRPPLGWMAHSENKENNMSESRGRRIDATSQSTPLPPALAEIDGKGEKANGPIQDEIQEPAGHTQTNHIPGQGAPPKKESASMVTAATQAPDLAQVIGIGISNCMRSRAAGRASEHDLDDWFRALPADKEQRVAALKDARTQMDTAKQALEALYSRFRTMASTAKN